jgi:hypothetical protein
MLCGYFLKKRAVGWMYVVSLLAVESFAFFAGDVVGVDVDLTPTLIGCFCLLGVVVGLVGRVAGCLYVVVKS